MARSLEQTPTWAVAVVCFVLVLISIIIEFIIHFIGKWLKKKQKLALYEALEKIKAELMLLGFISLLLTVGQGPISRICIPASVGDTWHPCQKDKEQLQSSGDYDDKCSPKGKVALVSTYGIHQLHIFIFILALFHILYSILTMFLSRAKMRIWKKWEKETRTTEYQFSHDPQRFRFTRNTTFGRRHLNFWSKSPILLWVVCFFRQFFRSVLKVDYMTLRYGFIMAHLAPQSANSFDFQKYIKRSLEDDFKVVVGISPLIWFFAILFIMSNTHGWFTYLWLPFIPLIIILLVGTKLQVIITMMGLRIQDSGDVIRGVPIVKPTDELFWFNRPRFLLSLIHFVLFQNAFQLAFFAWTTYEFGLQSCYHEKIEDVSIRISMGVLIQFLCSYVTLPLYALVTQMGSSMKPTIFNDRVATALKKWHHEAKKKTKLHGHSSIPSTPTHGTSSPIHLFINHQVEANSSVDHDPWESEGSYSPSFPPNLNEETREVALIQIQPSSLQEVSQQEINIGSKSNGFSFDKRSLRV